MGAVRPELLVQGGFSLAAALLYAWVARLVQQRSLSDDARTANALFATWWSSFALFYGLTGAFRVARGLGLEDLSLALVVLDTAVVLLCVGLWGLLGYLVYLYTGSRRWFAPLGAGYALFGITLLYLVAWMEPVGFREDALAGGLRYARPLPQGLALALGLLFAGPIVAGAIAYGSLYFRVRSPEPRYRIGMVAGAFLLWFGWLTISTVLDLADRYPNSLALYAWGQSLVMLVPLLVILAFRPPAWVRARLREGGANA